ncbi:hypothetical protein BTUL_0220g00120 [Botrytis tulipae]|uniref:Uncharacterized protein n=1 Tax=Botrytis tulipae TaxID=87230 RepID=A0A4Z1EFS3_9HELO|nr:hypothetical protein BTUL_0220g00120 [Botrytis tulipae]
MSDDKQLIEVLSLKKTLRPAATIDTNYVKDGKLVYEMFTRNIKSRDISPRLAGQVEAIIEVSNDILKKPNRLFRGTLRRRKLYKQLELLEGGLQKLVDGIKVADKGTKEVKRLQAVNNEEKERHQMEKAEKERKITETEKEGKRLQAVNNEEKMRHQMEKAEKERKITETEEEVKRLQAVNNEEKERHQMEKVENERKITETEKELKRMEGVQTEAIRKQAVQRILLNYDDYVADRCLTYKQSMRWDRQYSAKYWSEIHEIIELEKEMKEKARSLFQEPPSTPMLSHLAMVALDLKVPVEDARRAQEEVALDMALERKKKADNQRQLKMEKKQARKELRASKDSERVSSTGTVLRHQDSALEMGETSWDLDENLLSDLF